MHTERGWRFLLGVTEASPLNQPLRIGIYLDTWDFGGIAAFCENLASGLIDSGYDVTLVLGRDYNRCSTAARESFEEMDSRRAFALDILELKNWPRRQRMTRVLEAFRVHHFDVLFINNFDPLLPCFNALAASTRLVSIGHGDHSHCYAQFFATQYFAHRHIAISRAILAQCRELCPPSYQDKVVLIPHGVPPIPAATPRPRREGQSEAGPLRVCYCGRFDFTDKRLQDLPAVWRGFQRLGGTGRLTMIGEGDVRRWLETQFAKEIEYGEVVFTGRLSGAPLDAALAEQEVFLSLSNWEGLGLAAVEAAMHGVYPVLSAVRSGHRDVVDSLGYGTLCPVGDTDAFSLALRDCEKNRATLATERSARSQQALEQYGLDRMIRSYAKLCEAVTLEPLRRPDPHIAPVREPLSAWERWKGDFIRAIRARFRR